MKFPFPTPLPGLILAALAAAATGAESDKAFPSVAFRGLLDARLVQVDAESSWLDGDLGKTRYGQGHASTGLKLAEAALIVLPRFNWSTSGYLYLKADPEQDQAVDLVEGYLAYQPVSTRNYRLRTRCDPTVKLRQWDTAGSRGIRRDASRYSNS